MKNSNPSYEDLKNKIQSLELELSNLKNNNFKHDCEEFLQNSKSIYYQYSNKRGGLFWSNRVKEILGFSPEELKDDPFLSNNPIHPEDQHLVDKAVDNYKEGADNDVEYRIKTKSGKWIWLHDHFIRKVQIGDEIIIDGNALDVTLRKEAEIALQQSKENIQRQNTALRKLNADKNRFISIIAHDLKNPFNNIRGLLKLILENFSSYNSDDLVGMLQMMNTSAEKYYTLLEDILSWARTQSGNFSIQIERLVFLNICKEVIENLQGMAANKEITIQLDTCEFELVFSDKNILATTLRNLISNSIKFTNHGGIINISLSQSDSESIVTVSDNGIGISPDRLKNLFEISQMQSTNGTNMEKGTGLGLLLCKELIEIQSGKIWAESEQGKGSKFIFSIPFANPQTS